MGDIMEKTNSTFWEYWRDVQFEDALKCSVEEPQNHKGQRLKTMLFGNPEQLKQTGLVTSVSFGEYIYDRIMIDPTVVDGLDFARTQDLGELFTLSQFAGGINTTDLSGDMAQLQGYVAEQMIAEELQAKGHDVEFPEASNNPGYDLIVDGQPFQVKNLSDPSGVTEHLDKYPDIPVYINEELAPYFEGDPQVYVSNVSHSEVIDATTTTLSHADDLLDFEIPWIAAGVSSIFNVKRVWKDDVAINQAVFNVISDTSSRVVLSALGQKAGVLVGVTLFGPAGGVTGAMFGAFAGASQGGKLSTRVRRFMSKKQEREMVNAFNDLVQVVLVEIDNKIKIKEEKLETIKRNLSESLVNKAVLNEVENRHLKEVNYLLNKKDELNGIKESVNNRSEFVLDLIPNTMAVITKTGVHPYHYQDELIELQSASKEFMKKV